MILQTVNVSIAASQVLGGAPVPRGTAVFTLTRADIDGGVVVPQQARVTLDQNGEAVAQLWPNARGTQGSQYRVELYAYGGELLFTGIATVPNQAVALHDVLTLTPATLDSAAASALAAQNAALAARTAANLILVGL